MEKNIWYSFHDHHWHRMDDTFELRAEITRDFVRRFEGYRLGIGQQQQSLQNISHEQAESLQKKITGAIARLKTTSFKNNLIREAREWFYKQRFEEWIDQNNGIMGLNDAVLEVVKKRIVVRDGKPEDYVSKSCGISWPKHMTKNNPQVQKLKHWFKQCFTDKELRRYFWKSCASTLRGGNVEKQFVIWSGAGNNSKSMVVKLFEATFGVYCIKFPTSLLTGKRTQSSAAMPELAQAKSARQAFLQEPDDDEQIKGGILKELTGGDSFFARLLHDNGGKVKSSFSLILMCNKIPPIPTGGTAVKNRLRIIPFMSTWAHDAPMPRDPNNPADVAAAEEEQFKQRKFKINPLFDEEIPKMAQAFLFMLVHYFEKYMEEGLKVPKIVEQVTDEYWSENDVYHGFVNECMEIAKKDDGTVDNSAKIMYLDMYREFKQWFKDNYPGSKVPDGPTFKAKATERLGRLVGGRFWCGIRIKTQSAGSLLQNNNNSGRPLVNI